LWVAVAVGCATTKYEEFGEAPKDQMMRSAAIETVPLLEQRVRDLEERVARIEAELASRFTGFETSQGDLATRVMALAEQLEALSMQVQSGPKPVQSGPKPERPPGITPSSESLERL
jgi:hypothetical protein